jgi:hypothetical protein
MSWSSPQIPIATSRPPMMCQVFGCALFVACALSACGGASSTLPAPSPMSPSVSVPSPPSTPAPGTGINGRYIGKLTFTEQDPRYGWPTLLTVVANLHQDGANVTGEFDLSEVMYSGGYVNGIIGTTNADTSVGTFIARFLPDDLGDPFSIDTKITSPDGGRFEGTFIFADGVVGRGTATFTRADCTPVSTLSPC